VYVQCYDSGNPLTAGETVAVNRTTLKPTKLSAANSPLAYRIHGGSCAGGVTAWMDVLNEGHFVYGADPVAVSGTGATPREVDLTLQDFLPSAPPSAATNPSIGTVSDEPGGFVVQ